MTQEQLITDPTSHLAETYPIRGYKGIGGGIKVLPCIVPQMDLTTSVTSYQPCKCIIWVKFVPPKWIPGYTAVISAWYWRNKT